MAVAFNSSELAALFNVTPKPSLVTLMGELTVVDAGVTYKSQTITLVVANSVGQPEDGTPSQLPTLQATDVQAVDTANTVNWTDPHAVWLMIQSLLGSKIPSLAPQITALVGGGAAHLDGIPTFGGSLTNAITADGTIPLNYTLLIFPTGSPGGEIWRFEASAATANANGVVLPVDHDPVHNANAWILKN